MTIDDKLFKDLQSSRRKGSFSKGRENLGNSELDQKIIASSRQVLQQKISFQPAEKDVSFHLQDLRGKYVPLNPMRQEGLKGGAESHSVMPKHSEMTKGDGIPAPKHVLYNPEKVSLDWKKCKRVGVGLINMGNTCFLNSTLQCLTYTPPLANYLLSQQHKEECSTVGFCMLCELTSHMLRVIQNNNGQPIRPMVIIHKLKHIAKHFHLGRQEDAHEFLRHVVEAMQKSCVTGLEKLDKSSKETSVVHQIFGGYYRSRVVCSLCHSISDTFDPFLDIGLDIKHVPSVSRALERLIRPETLDGENMYKCGRCSRKVPAQKKFTIHRVPNILTLCLKKFDFNRFSSGKIHKDITYPENLNLRPFMSDTKGPPIHYQLYAVLTHQGSSCNSGHYFCFVRAPNKMWYCMNDAHVSQASLSRVLHQDAYLLFYIRKQPPKTSMNEPHSTPKPKFSEIPRPLKSTSLSSPQNGHLGTPFSRPSHSQGALPSASVSIKPKMIPEPPSQKKKIRPDTQSDHSTQSDISKATLLKTSDFVPGPKKSISKTNGSVNQPRAVSMSENKTKPLPNVREKLSFKINTSKGIGGMLQALQNQSRDQVSSKEKTVKKKSLGGKSSDVSRLVPYDDDEDSSSVGSEVNYDAVAEQLSKAHVGGKSRDEPSTSGVSNSQKSPTLANSTDLTTVRNHSSPLKLTITTNGNAKKLNSTSSTWKVTDSDGLVSPSIHSESSTGSNHSSNSTSEWNVKESHRKIKSQDAGQSSKYKKSVADDQSRVSSKGSVSPGLGQLINKEEKSHAARQIVFPPASGGSDTNDPGQTTSQVKSHLKDQKTDWLDQLDSEKDRTSKDPVEMNSLHRDENKNKNNNALRDALRTEPINADKNLQGESHNEPFISSKNGINVRLKEKLEEHKQKKKRKHFKRENGEGMSSAGDAALSNDSDEWSNPSLQGAEEDETSEQSTDLKGKLCDNGKAHQGLTNGRTEKNGSQNNDESGGACEQENIFFSGISDKTNGRIEEPGEGDKNRVNGSLGESGKEISKEDKNRSHFSSVKKGETLSNRFQNQKRVLNGEESLNTFGVKRQRFTQGRHERFPRELPKRHGYHNNQNNFNYGAQNRERIWSEENQWTGPQAQHPNVHTQQWDHHINEYRHGNQTRPPINAWDGRQAQRDDVQDYLYGSTLNGYGGNVQSWNGGRSMVDADWGYQPERMRDPYDEEFDQGKTKKIKNKWRPNNRFNNQRNHFQEVQNRRNRGGSMFSPGRFYSNFRRTPPIRKSNSWHFGHRR